MERLVTPEAVELELDRATVASRIPGRVLDLVIQLAVLVPVGVAAQAAGLEDVTVTVLTLLAGFLVLVVYPIALETRFGATLGQRAMGLRIVTDDGGPIRLRQALVRAAVGLFEVTATAGVVAFVVAASRHDGKRLGDVVAGTVAVSVRVGTGRADVLGIACPPQLRGWAEQLDTTGLTAAHRGALRRFHERAGAVAPFRRAELAAGLADRLLAVTAATRPAGADPVEVLAAMQWAVGARGPATRVPPPPPGPPPSGVDRTVPTGRSSLPSDRGAVGPDQRRVPGPEPQSPPAGGGFVPPA